MVGAHGAAFVVMLSSSDDGFVIIERAKWGSERAPTLPAVAKKWLRTQAARQAERRIAAGTRWHETIRVMRKGRLGDYVHDKNDLFFTTRHGRPRDPHVIRETFVRVCDAAEIPWSADGKHGLRLHDLRHSALTLLIEAGATAREAMALAGHKSAQMFLHYTHIEEQARAKTAARMDRILGAG